MKKKYPVLKCDYETWKDIKPVLESFGINKDLFFYVKNGIFDIKDKDTYLISNFSYHCKDKLEFGNLNNPIIEAENSLRYLVDTKEEFLSAVAKLLGKTYPNYGSDYYIDLIKNKERKYLEENDRIHCSTEEEARKVISIYYALGYKWSGVTFEELFYNYYNHDTVYSVWRNWIQYGSIKTTKKFNNNIIPASEFINYYTSNNMEKRNIQIDIETARKWYNGDDNTLKELALQAYKEEELKIISFGAIYNLTKIVTPTQPNVPFYQNAKWSAFHKLAIIAEYLNEGWKPDWNNKDAVKWYIKKDERVYTDSCYMLNYGAIYFKSRELAKKAIEIMGDEINYIFG